MKILKKIIIKFIEIYGPMTNGEVVVNTIIGCFIAKYVFVLSVDFDIFMIAVVGLSIITKFALWLWDFLTIEIDQDDFDNKLNQLFEREGCTKDTMTDEQYKIINKELEDWYNSQHSFYVSVRFIKGDGDGDE